MLEDLKKQVCDANLRLVDEGLVFRTFGNASGIDRESGHVVIKSSGVPYDTLKPRHMVVVSLADGQAVEGDLKPSSDLPTHLELYCALPEIGGVAHTHSPCATAWAQARREIPLLGTTHADFFHGPIPCTRTMSQEEIQGDYESNVGKLIIERLARLEPMKVPAVLVADHGPFAWGTSVDDAVDSAAVMEYLAELAIRTVTIEPYPKPFNRDLLDKHYYRKHGPGAYYGQT